MNGTRPGYFPAALVARHIDALKDGGWTEPEIGEAAGLDRSTVHGIVKASHPHVHQATAVAVLALTPCNAPNRVPTLGTARRIQALAVMGWPLAHIGHVAGMYVTQINDVAAGRRKRITRAQAEAIDAVYRALCATPGPSPRTRTAAARNGWVPAQAWDDIDDPATQPRPTGAAVAA